MADTENGISIQPLNIRENIIVASYGKNKISKKCCNIAFKRKTWSVMRRMLAERLSESCAASWCAVPSSALRRSTRSSMKISVARQAAIYLVHVVFAANLTQAGRIFGRDRTTARHACMKMEDWREEGKIDLAFDALESALRLWLEAFSSRDDN